MPCLGECIGEEVVDEQYVGALESGSEAVTVGVANFGMLGHRSQERRARQGLGM